VRTTDGVYGLCESDHSDVIVECSSVEFGMDMDSRYVPFLVWVEFDVMIYVPFPQTDPQVMTIVPVTRIFAIS
jgi:hypothetical protein